MFIKSKCTYAYNVQRVSERDNYYFRRMMKTSQVRHVSIQLLSTVYYIVSVTVFTDG